LTRRPKTHAILDGTLAAEREAAAAFQRMAKAENTPTAYRAAVRAWCAWCERRGVPALPASGLDVAAFLAAERHRGLAPNTIDLRRAAIRYLHRAAGCPVPTDDACVSETVAGIRRHAAGRGELPAKKVAATATILHQILAPIPDDLRGRRDRAVILVGFAGALRGSELAPIRAEQLEKTERGLRLTPPTKGSQTDAVIVPPVLRSDRTLSGLGAHSMDGISRHHDRAGVSAHVAAEVGQGGRAPAPVPHRPSPRSSKRAPQKPGSAPATSAATASSAAG
jgi:integrase